MLPKPTTAFLHYTAPPVIGGVEGVMDAHAHVFLDMGYPVSMIAGRGSKKRGTTESRAVRYFKEPKTTEATLTTVNYHPLSII